MSQQRTLRSAIIVAMCDCEHPLPPDASGAERDTIEIERQMFGMAFAESSTANLIDWLEGSLVSGKVRLVVTRQPRR